MSIVFQQISMFFQKIKSKRQPDFSDCRLVDLLYFEYVSAVHCCNGDVFLGLFDFTASRCQPKVF